MAPNPGNRMPSTRSPPSSRNWHPTPSQSSTISMAIKGQWRPEYKAYLKSNAERANALSKLIGDYLDYEGAKARAQGLGEKAGFSGP